MKFPLIFSMMYWLLAMPAAATLPMHAQATSKAPLPDGLKADPLFGQVDHLSSKDGPGDSHLGWSVAISGDTAVVAAPYADVSLSGNVTLHDRGAVYVFTRSGSKWSFQQKLHGPNFADIGWAVALDGDTLVSAGNHTAHVFQRVAGTWTYKDTLGVNDPDQEQAFGSSLAISGTTILVGDFANKDPQTNSGAVYVYEENNGDWQQTYKIRRPEELGKIDFGMAVAIEGDTAVIGAPFTQAPDGSMGTAFVFKRFGTAWNLQATLKSASASGWFGRAVDISGNIIAVGAPITKGKGGVFLFERQNSVWTEIYSVFPPVADGVPVYFGALGNVALSGDSLVVGSPRYNVGANELQGAAFAYKRMGNTWVSNGVLVEPAGEAKDWSANAVAIDGDTALVGSGGFGDYNAQSNSTDSDDDPGTAIVHVLEQNAWHVEQVLDDQEGAAGDYFSYAIAMSADVAIIGSPLDDVATTADAGSAYVLRRDASGWKLEQKLLSLAGTSNGGFGASVAVWGDTAVVAAPFDGAGSVYVFRKTGAWSLVQQIDSPGMAVQDFGGALSLMQDDLVIGAPSANLGQGPRGAAFRFTRDANGLWTQSQIFEHASGVPGDAFGGALAQSQGTLMIGAAGCGSVFAFHKQQGAWSQEANFTSDDFVSGDGFGSAIALTDDFALIGAPWKLSDMGLNTGAAYVFKHETGSWTQEQRVPFSGQDGDSFGYAVGISTDVAAIGCPKCGQQTGSVTLLKRVGESWQEHQVLLADDRQPLDLFGFSLALDPTTALIAAPTDDIAANMDRGSVYVFENINAFPLPSGIFSDGFE